MEQMIKDMMTKVDEFHKKITLRDYDDGGFPKKGNYEHLIEELRETMAAHAAGDRIGVVDGLIDLVYVALGALLEIGVMPSHPFDAVHEANMKKVPKRTERYGSNTNDAVKPEGWTPPDIAAILERMEILMKVSPIFVELTRLRIKKGNNYNRGNVKREDHFPLGDYSFFQVVWMKMCRVRSLVENPDADSRRLVEREMADILVYGCFWLESIRGVKTSI